MRRHKVPLFLLLILAGLLVSCSSTSGSLAGQLTGKVWKLSAIDGNAPLTGTKVTIQFKDGKISGSTGCNSYGGAYQFTGEKGLQIKDVVQTEMACLTPDGVMDQESKFSQALNKAASLDIQAGKLILLDGSGKALLAFTSD